MSYDVQASDELFIKDEAYFLAHLLNDDEYMDQFVNGTIVQGFFQVTGYHRWHSPLSGTIRKIIDVTGTYFAQAPGLIGEPLSMPDDPDYVPHIWGSSGSSVILPLASLFSIDSDNANIDLMCFKIDGQHTKPGAHLPIIATMADGSAAE